MSESIGSISGAYRPLTAARPERWRGRLSMARAPEGVVRIANEYIAAWSDEDRRRLPTECVPVKIRTPQELADYAFLLTNAQFHFDGHVVIGMLVDRLAVFFSYASARASQLSHIARVRV